MHLYDDNVRRCVSPSAGGHLAAAAAVVMVTNTIQAHEQTHRQTDRQRYTFVGAGGGFRFHVFQFCVT